MREQSQEAPASLDKQESGVIDLGAASEMTKGIPYHLTVEAFMSRPPFGVLSDE